MIKQTNLNLLFLINVNQQMGLVQLLRLCLIFSINAPKALYNASMCVYVWWGVRLLIIAATPNLGGFTGFLQNPDTVRGCRKPVIV